MQDNENLYFQTIFIFDICTLISSIFHSDWLCAWIFACMCLWKFIYVCVCVIVCGPPLLISVQHCQVYVCVHVCVCVCVCTYNAWPCLCIFEFGFPDIKGMEIIFFFFKTIISAILTFWGPTLLYFSHRLV